MLHGGLLGLVDPVCGGMLHGGNLEGWKQDEMVTFFDKHFICRNKFNT